jgi:hypothetical protein
LGQRILPSATPFHAPVPVATTAQLTTQPRDLAGQGCGTYTGKSLVVDAGPSYTLHGTAVLFRMGQVTVDGSVNGLGLIASGYATGTLTLRNDDGTVTIELKGPKQTAFTPLPEDWQYSVTSATGDYNKVKGETGTVHLTFKADAVPMTAGVLPTPRGKFIVSLDGGSSLAKPQSGIDGLAEVDPILPVVPPSAPKPTPLAGAVILVETADGTGIVDWVVADKNGRFHVNVPPGTYRLVPFPPQPSDMEPRGTPQTVVVKGGDDTDVTVLYEYLLWV